MIELYFSTVKILAQRLTHISAVATVLLITKTFTVKYYDRRQHQYKYSINNNNNNNNNKIIIITHIKRDSDCNANEKAATK